MEKGLQDVPESLRQMEKAILTNPDWGSDENFEAVDQYLNDLQTAMNAIIQRIVFIRIKLATASATRDRAAWRACLQKVAAELAGLAEDFSPKT